MSDLLIEAQDELRQERLNAFWKENGPYILAFVILSVLATAFMSGYRTWDAHVQAKQTTQAIALVDASDFPNNINADNLKLRSGIKGTVLTTAAGQYLQDGNIKKATALYTKVSNDKSLKSDVRDLATIMAYRLAPNNKDMGSKIEKISKNSKSTYQAYALLAQANAIAENNAYEEARALIATALKIENLPKSFYDRALAIDGIYRTREQK